MENEPVSPAVVSLLSEQAEQSATGKTRLEKGLEDTFPASDPVSVTHTATATGPTEAGGVSPASEPIGLHPVNSVNLSGDDSPRAIDDALQEIRRDIAQLRQQIDAASVKERFQLDGRPLAVVGAAAALFLGMAMMRRV
jgi:hypothetical protein